MKLNKILMALSAMAIVGCSSEDFDVPSATQAIDDSRLIQLDENFVLAGVGADGTTTRTHWELKGKSLVNKFLPIWATTPTAGQKIYNKETGASFADLTAQAVGLCWLGNGAAGTNVYTNYEFYHFGWLNNDEKEAKFDCGNLTNGSLYSDITVAAGTAGKEAIPGTDWKVEGNGIPTKSQKDGEDNLNYNSGVYKTDNKAIFGGQYIVYYPYNENFKDAGTIPAVAQTVFPDPATGAASVSTALDAPELGKATFRYSAPVEIKGGNQAADFGLYNLSSLVQLRVAGPKDYDGGTKIDQIVLYSEKEQLLKQANLAADKIAAGKKGTELYADAETKGTKTIVANFQTGGVKLNPTNGTEESHNKPISAYITVLPTTVEDLVVLVHGIVDGKGKWAKVSLPNTVFEAGAAKRLDIEVKDADFKADFIAVDGASLNQALLDAEAAVGDAEPYKPQTITVIGDITIPTSVNVENAKDRFITIEGGDIIVPQNVELTLATLKEVKSTVRVLGKDCCTAGVGGRLVVTGTDANKDATILNNVTLEKTEARVASDDDYNNYNPQVTYQGAAAITIAAGKKVDVQAGNVIVNAAVAHKGDIKIAKGAKVIVNVNGGLNFMGSNVTNDGTIEVMKKGKFDMTNSDGGATAAAGKRMTNNGTFIHNVDAAVGTAVQSMIQNGEYRCKVGEQAELADAYQKWTACSVIEIVTGANYNLGVAESKINYQHNGKYIDIEVNADAATTFNNPDLDNKEIKIGKLTVTKGALTIDFVKANGTDASAKTYNIGKRALIVNGDMTVAAEGKTTTILDSKKVNITGNLNVINNGQLIYNRPNTPTGETEQNNEELAVAKDINVNGAKFVAQTDALNITCANFYLKKVGEVPGTAIFGNRTAGDAKNMVVSGTIDNPKGCTFSILPAGEGTLQAWVSCTELKVGGNFPNAQPQVVE